MSSALKKLFESLSFTRRNKNCSVLSYVDSYSKITSRTKINRFAAIRNSSVGEYSYVGPNTKILNCDIGRFCSIAKGCDIGAATHPISFFSTSPVFYREHNGTGTSWISGSKYNDDSGRIEIGSDVWIGMNTMVFGGIKIGDGAIIGALSVVKKDVPPYTIVAGVPAKVIRPRYKEDLIRRILDLKIWELDEQSIFRIKDLIATEVTHSSLDQLEIAIHNLNTGLRD